MNLRDLKYLVAVSEHLHYGKAALACHVSQPALSMQLQKLEDYLGVQLFERSNKRVLITPVGEKIVARARDILQGADDIVDIANQDAEPRGGALKLGAFPTLAPYFLPHIVPAISQTYPDLKLLLIEEKTEVLVRKLQNGDIDAALLATDENTNLFTSYPLFDDTFLFAAPRQHPKAKLKTISQSQILEEPLLLLEEGHCLRDQALDFCHLGSHSPEHDFKATSLETLRQMVAAGIGVTLMPKMAIKPDDGISYIPITAPAPHRTIALVWRKTSPKHDYFIELAELMKACQQD